MKKITLLSIVVLASTSLTFANSDSETGSCSVNNKHLNETELEIKTDIENDETYKSILNDFENYFINSTVEEENTDIQNMDLYKSILDDFNK